MREGTKGNQRGSQLSATRGKRLRLRQFSSEGRAALRGRRGGGVTGTEKALI